MNDDTMHNNLMELSARQSANTLLLEAMYTLAFQSNAAGFKLLMEELQRLTREQPRTAGPYASEDVLELQARTAVHLERFGRSVAWRLSQTAGQTDPGPHRPD